MVEFQCLRSGKKMSFDKPEDIMRMRKEISYKEVTNGTQTSETPNTESTDVQRIEEKVLKKRGRPSKK